MIAGEWLTGRRGQALAAGIGVCGLALIWFGILDPLRSWFNDRAGLLEQREQILDHMRDLAATLPAWKAASTDKQGAESATVMLEGESDAIAAANLQQYVQKMAIDAGAALTAVETLPPEHVADHWHKIALRISLNASWGVLMELIRSVEQSPTRILIDDVRFRSAVAAARPAVMPIQASMVVYGFRPAAAGSGT
jgi:general secretion pathway protein M